MPNKDLFTRKCIHMLSLLSDMRVAQIIITNKRPDDLVVDMYCEQCQEWCFGVQIGQVNNRQFDYGKDLIARKITGDGGKNYVNMKIAEEHRALKKALRRTAQLGCMNKVYRKKDQCKPGVNLCETCEAKNMLENSEIDI